MSLKTINLNIKLKEIKNTFLIVSAIFLFAFIFSFQASNHLFITTDYGTDASVFQYIARVIINGGMPYKDAFDHKGPLIYLINVMGILISEWRGIWVLQVLSLFITFSYIYQIARLKCNKKYSFLLMIITTSVLFKYYEKGNLTEEFALPFIAVSIYIFCDYFLNNVINRIRLIVCGLSFGVVCLLRINMAVLWVVMCLGVLYYCIKRKHYKELIRYLVNFLIGICAVVIPICVWLWVNGAFHAFINDYFLFNLLYSSDAERANLAAKSGAFVHFFNEYLFLFALSVSVLNFYKKKTEFELFYVFYLVFNIVLICISGQIYMHYGMILVPALVYPLSCLSEVLNEDNVKRNGILTFAMIFLSVTFAIPEWMNATDDVVKAYVVSRENKESQVNISQNVKEISDIVVANSGPDDKIIVCGNWNGIYNYTNRFAATRYSYQTPVCQIYSDMADEFLNDIDTNSPRVVVIPRNYFIYEEVIAILHKNNYRLTKSTVSDYQIYVKDW